MILLADSEGPDQTAQMRRLIRFLLSAYAQRHILSWRSQYIVASFIVYFTGQYSVKDDLLHHSVKVPFSSFKSRSKRQMQPDAPAVSTHKQTSNI